LETKVTREAEVAALRAIYDQNGPGSLAWDFSKSGQVIVPDDGQLEVDSDSGVLRRIDLKKAGLTGELRIKDLPGLARFSIKGDALTSVVLENLPALADFNVRGCRRLTLKNLPALQWVDIRDDSLQALIPAGGLGEMPFEANVESRALTSLEVEGRNDILELYVNKSRLSDLRPILRLKRLAYLKVKSPVLSDLSPLEGRSLSELYLESPLITDLKSLGKMKYVDKLCLTSDGITDLRPLVKLKGCLNWLDVTSNNLKDITPLAHLKLGTLGLIGDALSDLTPLAGMISLGDLVLKGQNLKDFSPLSKIEEGLWWYMINERQLKG